MTGTFAKHCCFTTSKNRSKESRYEESLERGALTLRTEAKRLVFPRQSISFLAVFFFQVVYSPNCACLVCHLLISGTLEVFVGNLQVVHPGDQQIVDWMLAAAQASCDFYIQNRPREGISYWDTGTLGLARLGTIWNNRQTPLTRASQWTDLL